MTNSGLWKLGVVATGTAALVVLGAIASGASAAAAPAAVAPAGIEQWGTVASVTYHQTATSATPTLVAVVEFFDGRRFAHIIDAGTRRLPAPGEVWNIADDTPPSGWKPRK